MINATETGGAPALNVDRPGAVLVLSWPETCADWKLRQADYFRANTVWLNATNTPVKVGNWWKVSLPAAGRHRFYQLKRNQP